jgi:hypothetical protein
VSTGPWIRSSKDTTGSRQETMLRNGARSATPVQPVTAPRTRNRNQMHQCNVGAHLERIAIDVAGPFPRSDQGNLYIRLLWTILPSGRKPTPFPIKRRRQWRKIAKFCRFGVPRKPNSDQGHNFESRLIQEANIGVSKTRTTPLHP